MFYHWQSLCLVEQSTHMAKTLLTMQKSTEERKPAILSHLSKYFGDEALDPIEFVEKDWNLDEFARGCPVNHFAPGVLELW
jgi:monoamine oxidase